MLIRNVEIRGQVTDIRLKGAMIDAIGALDGKADLDGEGGALIPALHDHHVHLNATAAAMNSLVCGPPDVNTEQELIRRLNTCGAPADIRGVGYHESVAGDIDLAWLDTYGPDMPVRIQHRSGRLWIFNSLAMQAYGLKHPENGRLYDGDVILRRGQSLPELKPLIDRLLSWGICGVTEVTPSNDVAMFSHYQKKASPLKLSIMGEASLSEINHPDVGPLKLHYHDHNLPALDSLVREIKTAHGAGRPVAAHCVTRAELMLMLLAIEEAKPMTGDRIEHAAIADEDMIAWMKRLGLIIVTQPNFIVERAKAYLKDVPIAEHKNLWRLRSFESLKCAAGSDTPFGDANPWKAMDAAVNRPEGLDFGEAISPEAALKLYTKPAHNAGAPARKIAVGEIADLCLLDRGWAKARSNLSDVKVMRTWIDGKSVFKTFV